jgi:hypothetical protein
LSFVHGILVSDAPKRTRDSERAFSVQGESFLGMNLESGCHFQDSVAAKVCREASRRPTALDARVAAQTTECSATCCSYLHGYYSSERHIHTYIPIYFLGCVAAPMPYWLPT